MNIPFLFLAIILITGSICLIDKWVWSRYRTGNTPFIVEQSKVIFPILILIFLLRAFLFNHFRVPSESLEPSVFPGEFLIVNQYRYGVRFPIWQTPLLPVSQPKRGDIAVFLWPVNRRVNFVKRIVGVPGDTISYVNKVLTINGIEAKQSKPTDAMDHHVDGSVVRVKRVTEDLLGVTHDIFYRPNKASQDFHNIVVPKGYYFMMGDNRDDSGDSRFWGFVPADHILGQAIYVWMSWDPLQKKIRWSRLGKAL